MLGSLANGPGKEGTWLTFVVGRVDSAVQDAERL
jgi:hypothetical protein